ncbi:MAG: hypothetical protein GX595_11205 [Lentisphaerae bacterium]|mgnify:CR=1 FL=1|nr:hypothetical protein [Lentisphaerota bacterium]
MPADPTSEFRKMARAAFTSAVKSDLTRICTVYIAAHAEAGDDPARLAAAEAAFRRGLESTRAILERGEKALE